jgi:hypothetical protein
MKNVIYQYWQGNLKSGVASSVKHMKRYTKRIGAELVFDHNRIVAGEQCSCKIYYEPGNPLLLEEFDDYDHVALVDIDVFPVDGLEENLFEEVKGKHLGICTEPQQPRFREIFNVAGITNQNDMRWCQILKDKWNIDYSYDSKGRPKVFNTGVTVFSKEGLAKAKSEWPSFEEYIQTMRAARLPVFYTYFQDYVSAMMHYKDYEFTEIHNGWNSYMHKLGSSPNATVNDTRTEETKFVHIMFRTADDWPEDALLRIANKPQEEWNLPVPEGWPN